MSTRKLTTKSSKHARKAKTVATPKKELARELREYGVKPGKTWTADRLKKALAVERRKQTIAHKQEIHERRSAAARKGWATRLAKPKELREWERARRELEAAQIHAVEQARAAKPRYNIPTFRWYDGVYFNVSSLTTEQLHAFLVNLKRRGVRLFRYEREVVVGEYSAGHARRAPSGFISTTPHFMSRYSDAELLSGNARYQLPSLPSMRVPGIDFIRFVVVHQDELQALPSNVRARIRAHKRETRETVSSAQDQAFYLRYGRRPAKKDRKLMEQLREELLDESQGDEDEEEE